MRLFRFTLLAALAASSAWAKAPPEEAAKLGNELTPVGAERASNADGSIPVWTGGDSFGPTAKASLKAAVMCEDVARTVHLARQAGPVQRIPQHHVDALHDRYQNAYGQQ